MLMVVRPGLSGGAVSIAVSSRAVRCAPWTRSQGVDPIGSALTCDAFVLVETPQPWPHDIGQIPLLAELAGRLPRGTRLLAVRPGTDPPRQRGGGPRPAEPPAGVVVTVWRRAVTGFSGSDHLVAADRLADEAVRLVTAPVEHGLAAGEGQPAPADLLLCGHGARDVCCGRLGTRLALDATGRWPGVRVRRCSHTGGHRYAPTGFTLPDGLAWGFLDEGVLDQVVRRLGPPPLRGHYRGTTALDQWGQVAERELFERFGWSWLDHWLTGVRTETAPDRRSAIVHLGWDGPSGPGSAVATVGVAREVPVLVCGEPPENARKTAPELALRSITLGGG
jgi:hypothetical protein